MSKASFICLKIWEYSIYGMYVLAWVMTIYLGYTGRIPLYPENKCKCETCQVTSLQESLRKVPNIDKEEAFRYMEQGECMGAEIEEEEFSFWFCKR